MSKFCPGFLPEIDPRPYINIVGMPNGNPSHSQNPKRKLSKPGTPFGPSSHLRAVRDRTRRGTIDRSYCTRTGPRGVPLPDSAGCKILRSTAVGRTGIWPANPTAATPFSHLSFVISGHFPATLGHPIALFHHFWTF